MAAGTAISAPAPQLALDLLRSPALAEAMRRQRGLPNDVLVLIKIAGGCADTVRLVAKENGRPPELVRRAAVLYLQQVLLHPGADSYRVLGVTAETPQATVREHMSWMMRWLHPDASRDDWESAFASRVLSAWEDVKSPERRARYDLARRTRPAARRAPPASPRRAAGSARARRQRPRLPWIAKPLGPRPPKPGRLLAGGAVVVLVLLLAAWFVPSTSRGAPRGDEIGTARAAVGAVQPVGGNARPMDAEGSGGDAR